MRYWVAALAVSLGLVVAGCGTSGSKSDTAAAAAAGAATTGATSSASSSATAPTGGAPAGVGLALKYTGGTAGAAKPGASPITIGFVSQQGGTPSYPEALVSAQAAVKYVNDNLGGVDGHPLAIKTCNIVQTEQQGQACGQQFVNSNVPLVINGGLSNGGQSFYGTLNNQVPVIEGIGGAPVDSAGKSTLVLSAGVLGVGGSMTRYIEKRYHPKTVSIVAPNVAITQLAVKELSAGLKQAGAQVTTASFAPDASDLLTPLIAANAKSSDVLAGIILTPQCPTFINAVKQLGRTGPVVALDLCINESVKKALGSDYPEWDYLAVEQIPYASNPSPDVASYLAGLHKYAGANADPNDYAGTAWSSILAGVRIMNKLGAAKVTRANMLNAVAGFKAPGFITPPSDCGAIPSSPGLCSPKLFFYHYNGNGNFTDEAPGGA